MLPNPVPTGISFLTGRHQHGIIFCEIIQPFLRKSFPELLFLSMKKKYHSLFFFNATLNYEKYDSQFSFEKNYVLIKLFRFLRVFLYSNKHQRKLSLEMKNHMTTFEK